MVDVAVVVAVEVAVVVRDVVAVVVAVDVAVVREQLEKSVETSPLNALFTSATVSSQLLAYKNPPNDRRTFKSVPNAKVPRASFNAFTSATEALNALNSPPSCCCCTTQLRVPASPPHTSMSWFKTST